MITLEFTEEPCHECDCCHAYMESLAEAGEKHKYDEFNTEVLDED